MAEQRSVRSAWIAIGIVSLALGLLMLWLTDRPVYLVGLLALGIAWVSFDAWQRRA